MAGLYDVIKVNWSDNRYFDFKNNDCYKNEKTLYSHLETEAFDNAGVKHMYYIMDYNIRRDRMFGEDMDRYCQRKFAVMVYYTALPTLAPQFGLFGITNTEITTMYITISHFNQASTLSYIDNALYEPTRYPSYKPKVGDYIKSIYNNQYYEIINVKETEEGTQFHQTKTTYSLNVRVWKNQNFDVQPTSGVPTSSLFDISAVMHQPDFLAINDQIDIEEQVVEYQPLPGEKDPTDPFGGF